MRNSVGTLRERLIFNPRHKIPIHCATLIDQSRILLAEVGFSFPYVEQLTGKFTAAISR